MSAATDFLKEGGRNLGGPSASCDVISTQLDGRLSTQHETFPRPPVAHNPSSGISVGSLRESTESPQASARSRSFFGPVKNEGVPASSSGPRFSVSGPQTFYSQQGWDQGYGGNPYAAHGGGPSPLALPLMQTNTQAPSSMRLYSASQPGSYRHYSTSHGATPIMNSPGMSASAQSSMQHPAGSRIISERIIEHNIRVPKRVTREDVIERMVMVPEKVVHEEIIEDVQTVRERVVEMAVPVVCERVVEVPEVEYVERIVEVPEIIVKEKFREVPRVEVRERIIEMPKIIMQERFVEVPDVVFRDCPFEKIVEVPEIREQIVYKEVPVPQYVEKLVPQYVEVTEEKEIVRRVPVPVEAVTTCEFKLPRLRPHYTPVAVPLYIPRFVEVAVPVDTMTQSAAAQADVHIQHLNKFTAQSAVSLTDVGTLAHEIENSEYYQSCVGGVAQETTVVSNIVDNWINGRLQIDPSSMTYASSKGPETHQQQSSPDLSEVNVLTRDQQHSVSNIQQAKLDEICRGTDSEPSNKDLEELTKTTDTELEVEQEVESDRISPAVVTGITRLGIPIIGGVVNSTAGD